MNASTPDKTPRSRPSEAQRRLDRLVRRARAAHGWERLWRAAVPPLLVAGLFLCASWMGIWLELPHAARLAGVVGFVVLAAASLFGFRHLALLSRAAALERIDRMSGLGHRPASALEDTLANAGRDPATAALWALHRRRAEAQAVNLRAGRPSPRVAELDHYALRAAVLVALVACAFVAGSERYARVAAAFDWGAEAASGPGYRLDAWIDPPPYTGRPPVLLDLASDATRDEDHPLRVEAPAGSTVIVRSSGGSPAEVETSGPLLPPPAKKPDAPDAKAPAQPEPKLAPGDAEQRLILHGDSRLTLRHGGALRGAFALAAVADQPPVIMLREIPRANARGSLTLAYSAGDDYGVAAAEAQFAAPKVDGATAAGSSLVEPPKMALSIPPTGNGLAGNGLGDGETTGDLSEHPWAGARVTMTLVAHDEGGNEGRSEPVEITLPQRPFTNPLARALVEQRRALVLNPDDRARVQAALEALVIDPAAFGTTSAAYLGLRFASESLAHAQTKPDLLAVADFLWAMALQLENGDLSDAERALRNAEKDLRDAIDRHAPDGEIKKLADALQAAMDKFLGELAQQQEREDQKDADADPGRPGKTISPKQLQALLDKLKDASRSGNKEEAKRALEELQNLLENLKSAKRQKPDPRARAMAQALNELDQMTRDQQDLRDETFKDAQDGADQPPPRHDRGDQAQRPRPGQQQRADDQARGRASQNQPDQDQADRDQADRDQQGQSDEVQGQLQGSAGQSRKDALQKRQQNLRDRLDAVQRRLKQAGQGQDGLDDANRAMREAENALAEGEGSRGEAVDEQGKALEGMRKGAKKLAEAMQKGEDGEGQSEQAGQDGRGSGDGQQAGEADPLGRPQGGNPFNTTSRFDPMGVPAAQRAQRVLEELRRRLSDPSRSREETDYLERLLRSY